MSQLYRYPPSPVSIAGSIVVTQGTTPWIVSDPAAEASLASIDSKTPAGGALTDAQLRASPVPVSGPLTDTQLRATPVPVSISSGISNPLPVQDSAAEASLASIDSKLNTLGQKLMAGSVPVTIASDQSAVAVSVASLPLPSGAATEATLAAFSAKTAGAFVPEAFDYSSITYVGATTDIDTVTFKSGGAGGTTVAVLTMGYDGSNRLNSVTKT